jgi:hypothetical protein|tara:strand:+ start:407 stop:601 length:195 start_codon:yes stop_codon:yes gene_type:complete
MNKEEINKKLEEGILDLCAKDICELVQTDRLKEARLMAKHFGLPEKEIDKIIQEYKNGGLHNEL